jgi:hypothetical protein
VTSAVIYARVLSARQKKDETIASQTAALRAHAQPLGRDVPDEWVFEDDGHSGATLIRPALERLRDLIACAGVDVVLCYSRRSDASGGVSVRRAGRSPSVTPWAQHGGRERAYHDQPDTTALPRLFRHSCSAQWLGYRSGYADQF